MDKKEKPCQVCGAMFKPRNREQKYCSVECREKNKNNRRFWTDEEKLAKGYEWRVCKTCGKKFLTKYEGKVDCDKCVQERYRKKYKSKRVKTKMFEIEDKAREQNLSYGYYVALERLRQQRDAR